MARKARRPKGSAKALSQRADRAYAEFEQVVRTLKPPRYGAGLTESAAPDDAARDRAAQ